jgi:TolA-binding protein
MRHNNRTLAVTLFLLASLAWPAPAQPAGGAPPPKEKRGSAAGVKKSQKEQAPTASSQETENLKAAMEKQNRIIEELNQSMNQMRTQMQQQMNEIQSLKSGLDQSRATADEANRKAAELASLPDQVKSIETNTANISKNFTEVKKSADEAKKTSEGIAKNLNGFRFSGDFRLRFDSILRSSNQSDAAALVKTGAVQNARARYRLRLNVDKYIDKYVDFHMQLSTGPINNPLTLDQDFTSTTTRHPFFISEAWADVHNEAKTLSIQGGKVQEVFADNSRFLFDDDVRFNGFNEKYVHSFADGGALKAIEFRAGQYIFTNPNTAIVTAGSVLQSAGAALGSIGRASQMFHEGLVLKGRISDNLSHEFVVDDQYFRNPNQIALASTANGFPVLVNGGLGLSLSGAITNGTGSGTTTAGGAIFTAPDFNIIRLGYKMDWKAFASHPKLPVTWNVQVARNTGADFLRDAFLTSLSIGQSKEAGDVRFLYIWSIKDANSLISQVTDDDLGTGTGTNIATHHFRVDYTIRKGFVFQNLIFFQNERRPTNPSQLFFVPLQRGTPTQLRYQGQVQFTF